jgi:hypothetical protein
MRRDAKEGCLKHPAMIEKIFQTALASRPFSVLTTEMFGGISPCGNALITRPFPTRNSKDGIKQFTA